MASVNRKRPVIAVVIILNLVTLTQGDVNNTYYENLAKDINSNPHATWMADPRIINFIPDFESKLISTNKTPSEPDLDLDMRSALDYWETPDHLDLPEHFDLRDEYSKCTSIGKVKIQSDCGACWAIAASSAFSDRICIHHYDEGGRNVTISADHLLTCCVDCFVTNGCAGGDPGMAWEFIRDQGVPTGGEYNSKEGCKPYRIAPCGYPGTPPCKKIEKDLTCTAEACTNKQFLTPYYDNLFYVKKLKVIQVSDKVPPKERANLIYRIEKIMRKELYLHGSIVVGMMVYEDFKIYHKGIYHHVTGKPMDGHAIKLIGWGEENGTKYWIAINSWGKIWGDHGTFKIRRGVDECRIESLQVSAGTFDPRKSTQLREFDYTYSNHSHHNSATLLNGSNSIFLLSTLATFCLMNFIQFDQYS